MRHRIVRWSAVAIGMMFAARLSETRGLADPGLSSRTARLLRSLGLEPQVADLLDSGATIREVAQLVPPGAVRNLSDKLAPDGTLTWDVPAREWVILRTGMTPTGIRNAPASPEGQGLEVDKMNRAAAQAHFDAYIGPLLRWMPKADRKAFRQSV